MSLWAEEEEVNKPTTRMDSWGFWIIAAVFCAIMAYCIHTYGMENVYMNRPGLYNE